MTSTTHQVDLHAVFAALPTPYMVLTPGLVVVELSDLHSALTGRSRADLVGRHLFDAFSPAPDDPRHAPLALLRASMERVAATGAPDPVPLQRFEVPSADHPGQVQERWWSFTTLPVLAADGRVDALLQITEDVTEEVRATAAGAAPQLPGQRARGGLRSRASELEAGLDARTRATQELLVERERVARRLVALAEVVLALVDARDVAHLAEIVAERGLPALGCDGGAVAVPDPDDAAALLSHVTASYGEGSQERYARLPLDAPLPVCAAARTGRTVLLADRAASLAYSPQMEQVVASTGSQAFASLPLTVGGTTLGVLTAGWDDPHDFDADEVAVLEAFAVQCAQALQRLLLLAAERRAAAAVARMSEGLQRSLLTDLPEPDHLEVRARYLPAAHEAQVGGDWYDAFMVGDGSTFLVIGDVSGHDRDAAVGMAQVRNVLRGVAHATRGAPAAVLSSLDRAMRDLAVGALATAVVARVEQDDAAAAQGARVLRWSNAGHPPPLVIGADGSAQLLSRESDLLLGLRPSTDRHDHAHVLTGGETVLLYTDGLVERRGEDLDAGLERLRAAGARLAALPLEQLCDALLDELAGDAEDDVALLALRAFPEDRPRPAEAGPRVVPADLDELDAPGR